MKKAFQLIGLFILFGFSFFYTEKTITVLQEQDPLMIEIDEQKVLYKEYPVDAIINNNTIIPGIYGREVDIQKSYNNMQKVGTFNPKLIIYTDLVPSLSISKIYDKYLIQGNPKNTQISLVFIIKDDINTSELKTLINILKNKEIEANLFISINYLNNNLSQIKEISSLNEIYNYGNNGKYQTDTIILGNNLINNLANTPLYCLTKEENKDLLNVCTKNNMHTILITNNISSNLYNLVKQNLQNGTIFNISVNQTNLASLSNTIDFIKQKGYDIVPLSKLLSEKK